MYMIIMIFFFPLLLLILTLFYLEKRRKNAWRDSNHLSIIVNIVIRSNFFVCTIFFYFGVSLNQQQQTYMAPWLSIFGDFTKDANIMYNNFRVYGSILLVIMGKCNIFLSLPFLSHFSPNNVTKDKTHMWWKCWHLISHTFRMCVFFCKDDKEKWFFT